MNALASEVSAPLACPQCHGALAEQEDGLSCAACPKTFPVREGIPILVDLEALPPQLRHQVRYFENEPVSDTPYHVEPWQRAYVERFLANFPDVAGRTVIDCGTGSGYMAIELAKQGARVVACDLTLKSLVRLKRAAREEGVGERVSLVCCSAEALPFRTACADYFVSNAVLEHLPEEPEAIREIGRVCQKRGAGLMITVPLAYRYLNPLLLPINWIHDKRIGHLRRYDEESLRAKFPSFTLQRTYYTGHFRKVFQVLVNLVMPVFDRETIEGLDRQGEHDPWGASNIISFLKR